MTYDPDDIPNDVREEMADERRRRARDRHWCPECLGHTGPGSPCYQGPEEKPMSRYIVNSTVTVSCWTEVEATSPEEAKQIALERPMADLCHQPFSAAATEAWHFDSDGEPHEDDMEANDAP